MSVIKIARGNKNLIFDFFTFLQFPYLYPFQKNRIEDMNKPLILVTNDDGIFAGGIRALISFAQELGEVVVVAPDSAQSATGHGITVRDPLRLQRAKEFPDLEAWKCSGTPVDCVKLARQVILKGREIDLCVSGINHGSNASINIIYSGTVSAAMEASMEGINAIGFSLLDFSSEADFSPCKKYVQAIMRNVLEHGIPNGKLLNVNIPKLPADEIQGIKICRQAESRWIERFDEKLDPIGQPYYWMAGDFVLMDDREDTDIKALREGYVSVVPAGHDLTNYESMESMKNIEFL